MDAKEVEILAKLKQFQTLSMSVAENIAEIQQAIADACTNSGRSIEEVKLIAVSKTWPAEHVQKAIDTGQIDFGENRLQEGQEKIPVLSDQLRWHFIGTLQRNKVRKVLNLFEVIHSVDNLKLAKHIDHVAGDLGKEVEIMLQLNIGEEASKSGFTVDQLKQELPEILALNNLIVTGLMCIPPPAAQPEDARPWFAQVRKLRDELEDIHQIKLPQLSMGMSGDYQTAIEEGATYIRIGTQIFGGR